MFYNFASTERHSEVGSNPLFILKALNINLYKEFWAILTELFSLFLSVTPGKFHNDTTRQATAAFCHNFCNSLIINHLVIRVPQILYRIKKLRKRPRPNNGL
jgi:hypothetical protein